MSSGSLIQCSGGRPRWGACHLIRPSIWKLNFHGPKATLISLGAQKYALWGTSSNLHKETELKRSYKTLLWRNSIARGKLNTIQYTVCIDEERILEKQEKCPPEIGGKRSRWPLLIRRELNDIRSGSTFPREREVRGLMGNGECFKKHSKVKNNHRASMKEDLFLMQA